MNKNEAISLMVELMEISDVCYLSTIDEKNFPQTRAMLNLRNPRQYPGLAPIYIKHENDFLVYFTTNTSSQKIRQIKNNPNVSVYYSKPGEWRGLMLGGKIEIVADQNIKNSTWQDGWKDYYPGGVDDPDYSVLQLKPDILKLYHQLQFFTLNINQ